MLSMAFPSGGIVDRRPAPSPLRFKADDLAGAESELVLTNDFNHLSRGRLRRRLTEVDEVMDENHEFDDVAGKLTERPLKVGGVVSLRPPQMMFVGSSRHDVRGAAR